jgi:hypothetical protein
MEQLLQDQQSPPSYPDLGPNEEESPQYAEHGRSVYVEGARYLLTATLLLEPICTMIAVDPDDDDHLVRLLMPDSFREQLLVMDSKYHMWKAAKRMFQDSTEMSRCLKLRSHVNKDGSRALWMDQLVIESKGVLHFEHIRIVDGGDPDMCASDDGGHALIWRPRIRKTPV